MKGKRILSLFFSRQTILLWLSLLTFILTLVLPSVPGFVEVAYSKGVYPFIAVFLSAISSVFPFSVDDFFYLLVFLFIIVLLIALVIRKINFRSWLFYQLNLFAGIYFLFYFLWGFNYYRHDMYTRLSISRQKAASTGVARVFSKLIKDTNDSYSDFKNFDKAVIDFQVELSYRNLAGFLSIGYPSGIRKAKNITLSGFFSKASISGYFGPFFNEIHLNTNILPVEYPMVLAHEKAHQFGITSEAEANFYAWLVCSRSDSKQLRYSGNFYLLGHFVYFGKKFPETKESVRLIDQKVRDDFKMIENHWAKFRSRRVEKAAEKVNDAYLKTNRIKAGVGDYSGVIRYVLDFSLDEKAQKRSILNKK